MNIVFFGSSEFAIPSLQQLIASRHKILCVVTRPDRPSGRGMHFSATAIKEFAKNHNLEVYQPLDVNSKETMGFLAQQTADLFIVISFGQILSDELLSIPKIFAINLHPSLLPKYRGAAPINWAIINGERKTGLTVIKINQNLDAGPIILQEKVMINQDVNAQTQALNLASAGATLLKKALDLIETQSFTLIPQDDSKVSLAPRLKKEDGLIDWRKSAPEIINQIRGMSPWPGTFTYYKGRVLKIDEAKLQIPSSVETCRPAPGQIQGVSKKGIVVSTAEGNLLIERLQPEGRRKMTAAEFVAGHRISAGERLGEK